MNAEEPELFGELPMDATRMMVDAPSTAWSRVLGECVDVLYAAFLRQGRSAPEALEDARVAMIALGHYCGGRQIYLPIGDRLANAVRDRQIYHEYCGRNREVLALRYGLTERRVEQIVAEQRAIAIKRLQPDLFPPPR